jgi:hypothetical protein
MRMLIGIALLAAGFVAGWWARIWWLSALPAPRRAEPLGHDEYLARRERLDRAYTDSIREYDRLVTWVSGGALLVSITFVEKLAPHPIPATAWLLGLSWALLAGALLLSLISQYASSRVHSWRMGELDHLQKPLAERPANWSAEAGRLSRGARVWALATKWTTALSGLVLVAGMVALSRFAFQNVPFSVSP